MEAEVEMANKETIAVTLLIATIPPEYENIKEECMILSQNLCPKEMLVQKRSESKKNLSPENFRS